MPFKTCPTCQKPNGVRTLKCDCGFEFRKSKSHSFSDYVQGGEWRQRNIIKADIPEMPTLNPIPTLPPGHLSVEEIKDLVSEEGVGFCIFELIPPGHIADPRLQALWNNAQQSITKVMETLYA